MNSPETTSLPQGGKRTPATPITQIYAAIYEVLPEEGASYSFIVLSLHRKKRGENLGCPGLKRGFARSCAKRRSAKLAANRLQDALARANTRAWPLFHRDVKP